MGKSLVIVESPSKAGIINKYLGSDYVVKASVGHIRDLPTTGTSTGTKTQKEKSKNANPLIAKMGIDPQNNWTAHYEIMPGKQKVVSELKDLAKKADKIYLATDLDREGEAIAWHLKEVLGGDDSRFWRVKYPEITKSAIKKAFDNPEQINMDLVNAQQTRRFLDRVVGFMVSPLLWKKVGRGLSAGRVQSVAVELIVDREREIREFIPKEYWTVDVDAKTSDKKALTLDLTHKNDKKLVLNNEAEALDAKSSLASNDTYVQKIEQKAGSNSAPPPFTTSTLQQTANQKLGFSVKKTMTLAQRLYEKGYITYMRTDSVNLSQEAIANAREIIENSYGSAYLPAKPNYFKAKQKAQEAHEAIRPSHPELKSSDLDMDRDGQRLYDLIFARYLACQMAPQKYLTTTISAKNGDYTLKATGRVVEFDGYRRVFSSSKSDEVILPKVKEGDKLNITDIKPLQHFTQPSARYSEATLVKELEKDGIGRPSTYAAIIATIQDRGYVKIERGRFYAEKVGEIVTDRLRYSFANLMDKTFTASMEDSLDNIASGQENWIKSLNAFYKDFSEHLNKASLPSNEGGMPENTILEINYKCPVCNKYNMAFHSGKTGNFLACLGYYDKEVKAKDRCKHTINLTEIDLNSFDNTSLTEDDEASLLRQRKRCPICNATMDSFLINDTQKLHICGNAPKCKGFILETGSFAKELPQVPTIECDKCGGTMILKEGRFGKYMACTNAECKNTRKILKNGEVAPPREDAVDLPELLCKAEGSHYVLRDGASGIFLAAHNFPKVRETRPPKVSELLPFKDRISPKFHYLLEGPAYDNEGIPTEIRFSRKTKEQYLISTVDGKPTGFSAFYDKNTKTWTVSDNSKKTTKKASGKSTTKKSTAKKATSKTSSKTTAKKTTRKTTKTSSKEV